MINKSIAYHLSVYISLAVISVFITFIVATFIYSSKLINNNIETTGISKSSQIMKNVERQVVSTEEVCKNMSDQALYYAKNNDVHLLMSSLMKKYSYLNAIHINIDHDIPDVNFHNYFIFREKDSLLFEYGNDRIYHCMSENSFFEKVIEKNTTGWTEAFSCDRNNNVTVSYCFPIYLIKEEADSTICGSVICELSLFSLNDTINKYKINDRGYAFLVSDDGTYLTHPQKGWVLNKNLYDAPQKTFVNNRQKLATADILKNILLNKLSGTTFVYSPYLDNEKCWVHYTPIIETGWTLIILIPQKEMYNPLYLLVLRLLFFSVLGILVIFYIVTYISNRLIQPLSNVTTQLKEFSNFSGESELNTLNEVKIVSESLDYLHTWYEKFKLDRSQEEKLNFQRKQDLNEASEIQMSLINTDFSIFDKRDDVSLFASYKPARIVSGDLYDFMFLDEDHLLFTIGDVSGKGISAAFFMSVAQTIIKSQAKLKKPGEIVRRVNNELFTANHHQFFLTLFLGVLNLKTETLVYCNAAHTSTIILKKDFEIIELGISHGLPLGIYSDKRYSESIVNLDAGDTIVVYTDGVTELQNEKKEAYGIERLRTCLISLHDVEPENLVERITQNLNAFSGNCKQVDDITIMAIKYKDKKA
ncbi:MAG: SpoIIE family protein phosphatase [Draconibacterium sp.]